MKRQRIFYQWGGFELRKWDTNCERLQDFINNDTKEAIEENCIKRYSA